MRKGQNVFQWTVALLLALYILAPMPSLAQSIQIFVKVDGIDGESTDSNHKAWIDAFSYGGGVSNSVSMAGGAVGRAGITEVSPVTIVKQIDKASPKLLETCALGKINKGKVTIQLYEGSSMFFEVILDHFFISSVQAVMPDLASMPALTAASSPSAQFLQERVSFVFGRITWKSYAQGVVTSTGIYDVAKGGAI